MKNLISILVVLFVMGCSVNPSEVTDSYAKKYASKVKYVQDERTGICFAVIASRKTMRADQTGLGITVVDCKSCQHLLVD
jgi:hypothetical protein